MTIAFVLLGIVLIVLGFSFKQPGSPLTRLSAPFRMGGLLVIALGLLFSCVVQIDPGEVGVQSLFGKVQGKILYSGLTVVNPFVEVHKFNTKTQNYTMSGVTDEGDKMGDDAIRALTADGLELIIDLTILFRVNATDAPKMYREVGMDFKDILVRPIARTRIRDNAAYYEAVSLYSTKRQEFQNKIFESINADFKSRGLVLEQLLVRNITLPTAVKQTIESKIQAEQEAQKMQFVLQKERQEADRKRVEAQGISDYQRILSLSLTDKLLQYEQIKAQKELALSENAKVIIMGKGNTPVILGGQ